MSTTIYILKLEGGRYYVGRTDNEVAKRFQEHMDGKGSAWTRKYKPTDLLRTIMNASPFDEDRYVKEYMSREGIDKVRGGSYVSEILDNDEINFIRKEIRNAANKCTSCGRPGHFVKDCFASSEVVHKDDGDNNDDDSDDDSDDDDDDACYRCGYPGHYIANCYAKRDINGCKIY